MAKINDKLYFRFRAPKAHETLSCMIKAEDIEIDESNCWRCHNVIVDNLNYEVTAWGDLDGQNNPTTENMSAQVDYFSGAFDYVKEIEIINE